MDNNKLERLKEILSIPSFYGREEKIREFIVNWANTRGIDYYIDKVGNIYLTKGFSTDYYPCVVAHMDTVHRITTDTINIVEETYVKNNFNTSKIIDGKQVLRGYVPGKECTYSNRTGCGGDDKAGIFLALELIDNFETIKGAFFVSEEIGCVGSSQADENFFKNVAYAIQHDSPENDTISWYCSGYLLFDEKWATPNTVVNEETGEIKFSGKIGDLLYKYGVRNFAKHPYTDVSQLKKKFDFQCINLPAAYYHYHSNNECVYIEGIETAYQLSLEIINRLGNEKQWFVKQESIYNNNNNSSFYRDGYISQKMIDEKTKKYFMDKYKMSENDYKFLYEGLFIFIRDFKGEETINEIVNDFNTLTY